MTTKYRSGDIVTVRAKVVGEGDMMVMCSFNAPAALHNNVSFSVSLDDIVTHIPAPVKVGDMVRYSNGYTKSKYIIMCIDGDYAWIKHTSDDSVHYSVHISELERA